MKSPYSCYGEPRPSADATYVVQDGYHETEDGWRNPVRSPQYKRVKQFSQFLSCQYDASATDKYCFGCPHARPGAAQ